MVTPILEEDGVMIAPALSRDLTLSITPPFQQEIIASAWPYINKMITINNLIAKRPSNINPCDVLVVLPAINETADFNLNFCFRLYSIKNTAAFSSAEQSI